MLQIIRELRARRTHYNQSMMRPAIASRIIRCLFRLRRLPIPSTYALLAVLLFGTASTYDLTAPRVLLAPSTYGGWLLVLSALTGEKKPKKKQKSDYELDLGGNGPQAVGYVRVSSADQAKRMSPEAQEEELLAWAKVHKASYLYLKFDNGKSGIDFTKRKIREISELKSRGQVSEVWTRSVDRLGRDCFELATFFLSFLLDGGLIRTHEGVFTKEPTSFVTYVILAFTAQVTNEARARDALASKKFAFKHGKWNKPIPFGCSRQRGTLWIEKDPAKEEAVSEIFHIFLLRKSIAFVQGEIRRRYHISLSRVRLRHILGDPVYCGEPSLSGETVQNGSLIFIQKNEFLEVQSMLREIDVRHKKKADDLFQEVIIHDVSSLHDFLAELYKHYRSCGEEVRSNGIRHDVSPPQLTFLCPRCKHQWRFPKRRSKESKVDVFPLLERDYGIRSPKTPDPTIEEKILISDRLSKADTDVSLDLYSKQ